MSQFSQFAFARPLGDVLQEIGYETPTPVQAKAIPIVMEGRDVLATAQTGTGKTAAFALPLISKMLDGWKKQVLIVAPTRELAEQIGGVLAQLTSRTPWLKTAVIIGGMSYPRQIKSLRAEPSFVVGTPGRLIDIVNQGYLDLKDFGALVIDEADRLLDMGFEPQMQELVAFMPSDRQSLLFSATLADSIVRLANQFLKDPIRVAVGAVSRPVDKIRQDVIQTTTSQKDAVLLRQLEKTQGSVIVFVKTKFKTEKLHQILEQAGHPAARIHGDRTQAQRSAAIAEFREGVVRVLVATDIAARGIDIPHIAHVVNYDLPMCPEDYIHRIGRTARAGQNGHSLAFVTPEEQIKWAQIHKLMYGKYPDKFPKGAIAQVKNKGAAKNAAAKGMKPSAQPRNRAERRAASQSSPKGSRHDLAAQAERFLREERKAQQGRGSRPAR